MFGASFASAEDRFATQRFAPGLRLKAWLHSLRLVRTLMSRARSTVLAHEVTAGENPSRIIPALVRSGAPGEGGDARSTLAGCVGVAYWRG